MRVQDIDHIDLTVDDLEQAMRFYHEVLDLPILFEGKTSMILSMWRNWHGRLRRLRCRKRKMVSSTSVQENRKH